MSDLAFTMKLSHIVAPSRGAYLNTVALPS